MIGNYILETRLEQGVNQVQLSRELGITPQFMGRIEKGGVMIPEPSLVKSIKVLGLKKKRILEIYRDASQEQALAILQKAKKRVRRSSKK